jgi:aspartate-semialdehyde dehydrogenase
VTGQNIRTAVIGATGAVGTVTLELLAERGFEEVRALASSRSAGKGVPFGSRELEVEEATPELLAAGHFDLCFFSVGTDASRDLVPPAVAAGAVCIDKSDAYRLAEGIPLVVAGVNDEVLNGDEIVANPNCSAVQLACVLKPLHDAARLASVKLATYQSMSGAGDAGIERLRATAPMEADLAMDWDLDGDEFTEESKLRAETRKILGLESLPIQATCIRVPVLVGHGQAVWVETEEALTPEKASHLLAAAPHVRLAEFPTAKDAAGQDEVLVARIRSDMTNGRGLALWSVCDNLRKGAALNAVQIAEALLERRLLPAY